MKRQLVDIYTLDGSADNADMKYILGDLQQLALTSVETEPLIKTFQYADGSLICYAARDGTEKMTIELECSLYDARTIQSAACTYGDLVFAGLIHPGYDVHSNANNGQDTVLTGAVTTTLLQYGGDGLCKVSIPVQRKRNGTSYYVPEITATRVTIYGKTIFLTDISQAYDYREISLTGGAAMMYCIKEPIVLRGTSAFAVTFAPTLPSQFSGKTISVMLFKLDKERNFWSALTYDGIDGESVVNLAYDDGAWEQMSDVLYTAAAGDVTIGETDEFYLYAYSVDSTGSAKPMYVYFKLQYAEAEEAAEE